MPWSIPVNTSTRSLMMVKPRAFLEHHSWQVFPEFANPRVPFSTILPITKPWIPEMGESKSQFGHGSGFRAMMRWIGDLAPHQWHIWCPLISQKNGVDRAADWISDPCERWNCKRWGRWGRWGSLKLWKAIADAWPDGSEALSRILLSALGRRRREPQCCGRRAFRLC